MLENTYSHIDRLANVQLTKCNWHQKINIEPNI